LTPTFCRGTTGSEIFCNLLNVPAINLIGEHTACFKFVYLLTFGHWGTKYVSRNCTVSQKYYAFLSRVIILMRDIDVANLSVRLSVRNVAFSAKISEASKKYTDYWVVCKPFRRFGILLPLPLTPVSRSGGYVLYPPAAIKEPPCVCANYGTLHIITCIRRSSYGLSTVTSRLLYIDCAHSCWCISCVC